MTDLITADNFSNLLRNNTPLLDLRSPAEFKRGSLPGATNLPLLTDPQRQKVGTAYRKNGREAAIELGFELVDERAREDLLEQWEAFLKQHQGCAIYCWRGGLRSTLVQQWLEERGTSTPRIKGGFKALRRHLLDTLASLADGDNLIVVAGKTGSGKTHFINQLQNSLDLEGLAHHRGSAFGKQVEPQPAQIDFENALAVRCLHLDWSDNRRVAIEDESRAIGSLSVPLDLHQRMLQAPIAMLEESLDSRIETIHLDYIQSNYQAFKQADPESAEARFAESLTDALFRIRKRLGLERYAIIQQMLLEALSEQAKGSGIDGHKIWIEELLKNYYDPMYDYQLEKKSSRIVFRGNRSELAQWIMPLTEGKTP